MVSALFGGKTEPRGSGAPPLQVQLQSRAEALGFLLLTGSNRITVIGCYHFVGNYVVSLIGSLIDFLQDLQDYGGWPKILPNPV